MAQFGGRVLQGGIFGRFVVTRHEHLSRRRNSGGAHHLCTHPAVEAHGAGAGRARRGMAHDFAFGESVRDLQQAEKQETRHKHDKQRLYRRLTGAIPAAAEPVI